MLSQEAEDRVPARPALPPSVRLLGEFQGSGFETSPWLIQRDGKFVQVTELLYRVAEQANGTRTLAEIASAVTETTHWLLNADQVRTIIESKLMPLGIIAPGAESTETDHGRGPATPFAVKLRLRVVPTGWIDPIARVLRYLFALPAIALLILTVGVAQAWLYFVHGAAGGLRETFQTPGLLLLILGILAIGKLFHEMGHAAGLRYGGGRTREMGVGIYLIFPAFYTDVSEAYRLDRRARLRTDLGGVYFDLIFSLLLVALYLVTGKEFLLLGVTLTNLEILYQFIPLGRLDGYWILADLTGVPDLFSQIGPFLLSVLPVPATERSKLPTLKSKARVVFALYMVTMLGVIPVSLLLLVSFVPQIARVSGALLADQWTSLRSALRFGEIGEFFASVVVIGIIVIQDFAIAYLFYGLVVSPLGRLRRWRKSHHDEAFQRRRLVTRQLAGILVVALGGLISAVGGVILILACLLPWVTTRVTALQFSNEMSGVTLIPGRLALACGAASLAAGMVLLLGTRRWLRRGMALIAIIAGLVGSALATHQATRTADMIDQQLSASIERVSGQEASPAQLRALRGIVEQAGISASPGLGVAIAAAGGLIALAGGVAVLSGRLLRKGSTSRDPVETAPLTASTSAHGVIASSDGSGSGAPPVNRSPPRSDAQRE
jgi:putative peptide zinc metalloprotease protein